MSHETTITFRGGEREVEFYHEGGHGVIWRFPDDSEHADQQGGATEKEQQDIYEILWKWLEDFWSYDPEYDR